MLEHMHAPQTSSEHRLSKGVKSADALPSRSLPAFDYDHRRVRQGSSNAKIGFGM